MERFPIYFGCSPGDFICPSTVYCVYYANFSTRGVASLRSQYDFGAFGAGGFDFSQQQTFSFSHPSPN